MDWSNLPNFTGLAPRDYQLELYERARKGNHLLVLETGAGKTLVSIMLINDALAGERERSRLSPQYAKKFVVYLVNNVHLVIQQSKAIQNSIDAKVRTFYGDCGIDLRSHVTWKDIFRTEEVLVMTAQIFLNVLRHGFLNFKSTCLLIFDECHHARKNHPFNMIMQEFYYPTPDELRPQVFGMTASPTNSKKSIDLAQQELSRNLNSKLITAKPTENLREVISSPSHLFRGYEPDAHDFRHPFLGSVSSYLEKLPELRSIYKQTLNAFEELGNWAANIFLSGLMTELISEYNKSHIVTESQDSQSNNFEKHQTYSSIIDLWEEHKPYVDSLVDSTIELTSKHLSNKSALLINTLIELINHHDGDFRAIVFTQSRSTAFLLKKILCRYAYFKNICTDYVTGHGSSKANHFFYMSHSQQNSVIQDFRAGNIQLLIATNVAEEGLDIQPCNIIVRFNPLTTLVSYIQSRGRARAKDSKYVIIYNKSNEYERQRTEYLIQMESQLSHTLEKSVLVQECETTDPIPDISNIFPVYTIASTGAIITFNSSLDLLAFFTSFGKRDAYTDRLPKYDVEKTETGYRCQLTLPSSCSVRFVQGDIYPSKLLAKQSAAWKGCVDLHKSKAINDNLIPSNEFPENDTDFIDPEEFDTMGTHKVRHSYEFKSPDLWILSESSIPSELYLNSVEMSIPGRRPFIIATRCPFPSLPPISLISTSISADVRILPAMSTVTISKEQFIKLAEFNVFIFSMVLGKGLICRPDESVYFFAPLICGQELTSTLELDNLDWESIVSLEPCSLLPLGSKSLENRLIINKLDSNKVHILKKIHNDLNAHSPLIGKEGEAKLSLAQYIRTHFKRDTTLPSLPLIEAEALQYTFNYLNFQPAQIQKKPKNNHYQSAFFLIENSMIHPIAYDIFLSGLLLPSLFSRIDALLLTLEVKKRFRLDIKENLLAEALTLPSANLSMDYERLELLGDSFLKFMATVYLYVTQPKKSEGQLHYHRIRKISNKTLFSKCRKFGLTQYFTGISLDKSKWRPANFINKHSKDDLQLTSLHLNDKCLADVMEALLGAAIQSNGEIGGLQCLMNLGLCFDDIESWETIRNMYAVPRHLGSHVGSILDLTFFQEKLGYSFRDPSLLLESLTHSSVKSSLTSNYQRLEFLGDAVLDYLVVRGLVKAYPAMPPGFLTDLKALMVDNPTLASIAVHSDLPRHLKRSSDALDDAIIDFTVHVKKERQTVSEFRSIWSNDIPKPFSDIVESIIGAVLVDSGMDLSTTHKVVARLATSIYKDILIHSQPPITRPHKHLIRCFNQKGCHGLKISTEIQEEDSSLPREPGIRCVLSIHGDTAAEGTGSTEKIARDAASRTLLLKLNREPKPLKKCACRVR